MNKEEQEAIEKLKHHTEFAKEFPSECFDKEIEIALNYISKLEQSNKEWFDIADNILRATNKYGEISIGKVADYISKLQKELEQEKEKNKIIANIKYEEALKKVTNEHIEDIKQKVLNNFVSKDKIKNRIKELEEEKPFWLREEERRCALFILSELLEE